MLCDWKRNKKKIAQTLMKIYPIFIKEKLNLLQFEIDIASLVIIKVRI